jgi:hypothetical protein
MSRFARLATLLLLAAAALANAGCFNKEAEATFGETEGTYVTVDDLKYQVQISRILQPSSAEDEAYLRGIDPADAELADDDVWFAVFIRVENDTEEPHTSAERFTITDTQDDVFEPLELSDETNLYRYSPREVPPGTLVPIPDSPASDNTIKGSLLLFKIPASALGNRPLEFEIESPSGGENAIIDLDI